MDLLFSGKGHEVFKGLSVNEISTQAVGRLLVRTFLLAWFAVVGITVSLCDTPSCDCRVICALVGMGSGCVLFMQVVCAQLARHYRAGLSQPGSMA
jgi:hypothetical protein